MHILDVVFEFLANVGGTVPDSSIIPIKKKILWAIITVAFVLLLIFVLRLIR